MRPAVEDYRRHAVELRQPSHLWYSEVMWTVSLLLEGELEEAETAMNDAYAAGMRAQSWDAGAIVSLGAQHPALGAGSAG